MPVTASFLSNFRVAVAAAALGSSATSLVQNLFWSLGELAVNSGEQLRTALFWLSNIATQSLDNISRIEALPRHMEQIGWNAQKFVWRHDVNVPGQNRLQHGWVVLPSRSVICRFFGICRVFNVIHLDYKDSKVKVIAYVPLAHYLLILMSDLANKRQLTPEEIFQAHTLLKASPLDNALILVELMAICHFLSGSFSALSQGTRILLLVLLGTHVEGLITGLQAWNNSLTFPQASSPANPPRATGAILFPMSIQWYGVRYDYYENVKTDYLPPLVQPLWSVVRSTPYVFLVTETIDGVPAKDYLLARMMRGPALSFHYLLWNPMNCPPLHNMSDYIASKATPDKQAFMIQLPPIRNLDTELQNQIRPRRPDMALVSTVGDLHTELAHFAYGLIANVCFVVPVDHVRASASPTLTTLASLFPIVQSPQWVPSGCECLMTR